MGLLQRAAYGRDYSCYRARLSILRGLGAFFKCRHFQACRDRPLRRHTTRTTMGKGSLLTVFPANNNGSLAFRLPTLVTNRSIRKLAIIVSPLRSLVGSRMSGLTSENVASTMAVGKVLSPVAESLSVREMRSKRTSLLCVSPRVLHSGAVRGVLVTHRIMEFIVSRTRYFSS